MIRDYTKDDFQFIRRLSSPDLLFEDSLSVESDRLSQAVDYINLHDIKSITIEPRLFKIDNLDFLKLTPSVQALSFRRCWCFPPNLRNLVN